MEEFKDNIDIYEIGNELNGEWVGANQSEIDAKVLAAYEVVEEEYASLNLRSAIALNYWPSSNCYAYPWEATATYAGNMPSKIRNGVDYVFLSFYETACSPRAYPSNANFISIFNTLKSIFPNAKIGMGEIGAQGSADGVPEPDFSEKQRIANRYYGMHSALKSSLGDRYVGGYFWWYYYQDAVPYNKSETMWPTIEDNFNSY